MIKVIPGWRRREGRKGSERDTKQAYMRSGLRTRRLILCEGHIQGWKTRGRNGNKSNMKTGARETWVKNEKVENAINLEVEELYKKVELERKKRTRCKWLKKKKGRRGVGQEAG